LDYSLE